MGMGSGTKFFFRKSANDGVDGGYGDMTWRKDFMVFEQQQVAYLWVSLWGFLVGFARILLYIR